MKTKEVDTSPLKKFEDDEEEDDGTLVRGQFVEVRLKISIETWEAYKRTIPINLKLTDSIIYLIEERIRKVENG